MLTSLKRLIKSKLQKTVVKPVLIPQLRSELLQDRCALITGGTSGIGFAIARAFLDSGANVIIAGRSQERLDKASQTLSSLVSNGKQGTASRVETICLDIANINNAKKAFDDLVSKLPESWHIDILVNNAGMTGDPAFLQTSEEDFDHIVDVNLKGTYFITQMVIAYMREHNIQGNVLNITSSSASRPALTPYMVSKWGEKGFTLGLAKTLSPYGIVVNAIAPGPTATPMIRPQGFDSIEKPNSPIGRFCTPEEIANMAVILTSALGRTIVGDTVYMTGGSGIITYDDVPYKL